MKKNIIFLLNILLLSIGCSNDEVFENTQNDILKNQKYAINSEAAFTIAERFCTANIKTKTLETLSLNRTFTKGDVPLFYVFNLGNDGGFILISADSRTMPILGYSLSGKFDTEVMPDGLKVLLESYESELSVLVEDSTYTQVFSNLTTKGLPFQTGPYLTTKWGQGAPYNYLFSKYNAGCTNVAGAQIMNFYKWPLDFVTWDILLDDYLNQPFTDNEKIEVSRLLQKCRKVFHVVDSNGLNSSERILTALTTKLKYNGKLIFKKNYTNKEWAEIMMAEIKAGRVVYYFALRNAEPEPLGHSFVLDGIYAVNENAFSSLYHINWGWNGTYDGFYYLTNLKPDNKPNSYNIDNRAIIDLYPLK